MLRHYLFIVPFILLGTETIYGMEYGMKNVNNTVDINQANNTSLPTHNISTVSNMAKNFKQSQKTDKMAILNYYANNSNNNYKTKIEYKPNNYICYDNNCDFKNNNNNTNIINQDKIVNNEIISNESTRINEIKNFQYVLTKEYEDKKRKIIKAGNYFYCIDEVDNNKVNYLEIKSSHESMIKMCIDECVKLGNTNNDMDKIYCLTALYKLVETQNYNNTVYVNQLNKVKLLRLVSSTDDNGDQYLGIRDLNSNELNYHDQHNIDSYLIKKLYYKIANDSVFLHCIQSYDEHALDNIKTILTSLFQPINDHKDMIKFILNNALKRNALSKKQKMDLLISKYSQYFLNKLFHFYTVANLVRQQEKSIILKICETLTKQMYYILHTITNGVYKHSILTQNTYENFNKELVVNSLSLNDIQRFINNQNYSDIKQNYIDYFLRNISNCTNYYNKFNQLINNTIALALLNAK